jgi:hypothetical protein
MFRPFGICIADITTRAASFTKAHITTTPIFNISDAAAAPPKPPGSEQPGPGRRNRLDWGRSRPAQNHC